MVAKLVDWERRRLGWAASVTHVAARFHPAGMELSRLLRILARDRWRDGALT